METKTSNLVKLKHKNNKMSLKTYKPNKLLRLSSILLIYQKSTQTCSANPLLYTNECASNPCEKGYCEDHTNGAYTCYCDPGVQKDVSFGVGISPSLDGAMAILGDGDRGDVACDVF